MPVKPAFHPLYQQVKESLIRRIAIGEWAPGTFLPSEPALAEEYGVSHGTLRKALNELTAERRVVRYQGKGTAVATFDADEALFRFFRIVSCEDRRTLPISEVYSATPANADAEEAAALDIPVGAPVFRIERVRSLDGVPLLNESISLNCARMPGIEAIPHNALPNTLYDFFQKRFNVTIAKADESITAVAADRTDSQRLGVPVGHPLLAIRRVAMDIEDNPVELRHTRCVTANFHYRTKLS
ncbi:GntR family transcriptional regulator [Nitratidesulfovibrio sp. D1]|jgi:GntR family transcriptional regulator|uniref:GntR family transcriptional regulator n=1 Tax=Nitratidesulfovibrio sp. D1 TaxID=3440151 RepID=UPI003EC08C88